MLILGLKGLAVELYEYNQSVRAYGMGGVRVFSNSDAGLMLWNPASLALLNGYNWKAFDAGTGVIGLTALQDLSDVGTLSSPSDFESLYGKKMYLSAAASTVFTAPYFGIGIYSSGAGSFTMTNPAFPNLNITYFNDYGYLLGAAIPIGPFAFGLNAKRITRSGKSKNYGPADFTNLNSDRILADFKDEGTGYGFDLGLIFAPPAPFNPTISLSWQDVGDTNFITTRGVDKIQGIDDNLTLGISFQSDISLAGIAGGIEYRHMANQGINPSKKIHMGLELSLALVDIRAGFYQGYTSYGAGLDLWILDFNVASYSVEKGSYAGQIPEQRLQAGISMEFGFDPDFKLVDVGGKKRKLKQRR